MLATSVPVIGSLALVTPLLETATLPSISLPSPDSGAPIIPSANKAPAIPARAKVQLRNTKDLTISTPAKADPILPSLTTSSAPKLRTKEPHGELDDVLSDMGDKKDQKHRRKEVQNVSV